MDTPTAHLRLKLTWSWTPSAGNLAALVKTWEVAPIQTSLSSIRTLRQMMAVAQLRLFTVAFTTRPATTMHWRMWTTTLVSLTALAIARLTWMATVPSPQVTSWRSWLRLARLASEETKAIENGGSFCSPFFCLCFVGGWRDLKVVSSHHETSCANEIAHRAWRF